VLRRLDPDVLQANPKAFFGYSDNTNLLLYLWNLGIIGFHRRIDDGAPCAARTPPPGDAGVGAQCLVRAGGGSALTRGRDDRRESELGDPGGLDVEMAMRPGPGWTWAGDRRVVTGPNWGGCLEILDSHLRANRYLLAPRAYAGCVLLLQTSEEMPGAEYVYRMLMGMGERGMLEQFAAVVVATPKAWDPQVGQSLSRRAQFAADQRASILRALDEYNPGVPTVFGLDFGHTDPQVVIPMAGR